MESVKKRTEHTGNECDEANEEQAKRQESWKEDERKRKAWKAGSSMHVGARSLSRRHAGYACTHEQDMRTAGNEDIEESQRGRREGERESTRHECIIRQASHATSHSLRPHESSMQVSRPFFREGNSAHLARRRDGDGDGGSRVREAVIVIQSQGVTRLLLHVFLFDQFFGSQGREGQVFQALARRCRATAVQPTTATRIHEEGDGRRVDPVRWWGRRAARTLQRRVQRAIRS